MYILVLHLVVVVSLQCSVKTRHDMSTTGLTTKADDHPLCLLSYNCTFHSSRQHSSCLLGDGSPYSHHVARPMQQHHSQPTPQLRHHMIYLLGNDHTEPWNLHPMASHRCNGSPATPFYIIHPLLWQTIYYWQQFPQCARHHRLKNNILAVSRQCLEWSCPSNTCTEFTVLILCFSFVRASLERNVNVTQETVNRNTGEGIDWSTVNLCGQIK